MSADEPAEYPFLRALEHLSNARADLGKLAVATCGTDAEDHATKLIYGLLIELQLAVGYVDEVRDRYAPWVPPGRSEQPREAAEVAPVMSAPGGVS